MQESDILAISFTKNTVDELKSNLCERGYINVNVGTFHAVCGNIILQEMGFHPNSRKIQSWQVEKLFENVYGYENKIDINDILSFISYQKNYLKSYKDVFMIKDSKYTEEELRFFFKEYEEYKDRENLWDFEDYLIECYKILKNNPKKYTFDYILVDEHQDSNLVQNLILKELCVTGNIFCVFDYRQAIYTFRGGNPEYCMNFEKEWNGATIINLYTNYRSCKNIVRMSNNFIKKYYKDYKYYVDCKSNDTKNGVVDIQTYYDREIEAIEVVEKIEEKIKLGENPKDIAILYRLNSQSSYIENELKKKNINYNISGGGSFFQRKEIKGIVSYLRLIKNPHDDDAFQNIFKLRNYPIKFFSNQLFNDIKQFAGKHNLSLYEAFTMMSYNRSWQSVGVKTFENNIEKLRLQVDKGVTVVTLIDNINKVFDMERFIDEEYGNKDEKIDRLESIDALKRFVKSNTLDSFLSYVNNDLSGRNKKKSNDRIQLMTVHASKGLEFKNVFLVSIEDEKFPHKKSPEIDEARLFYVGITRAKENLYLSQIYDNNKFIKEFSE